MLDVRPLLRRLQGGLDLIAINAQQLVEAKVLLELWGPVIHIVQQVLEPSAIDHVPGFGNHE
eukprot:404708-Lingulodinium_polyedra.AAC.1